MWTSSKGTRFVVFSYNSDDEATKFRLPLSSSSQFRPGISRALPNP